MVVDKPLNAASLSFSKNPFSSVAGSPPSFNPTTPPLARIAVSSDSFLISPAFKSAPSIINGAYFSYKASKDFSID